MKTNASLCLALCGFALAVAAAERTRPRIGLYMSKNIIEKSMGGRLHVRNTGEGAQFRIEFPNSGEYPILAL